MGVGNWAVYGHIPALRLLPQFEICAVSSRNLERARSISTRFGIEHALGSVDELLSLSSVDLVAVLTPAPEHAWIVRAAIAAGKDVYCEWPLTTSSRDSKDLLRLASDAGMGHVAGLQRTLGVSSLHFARLLQDGYVGQVRSVRMHVSMESFGGPMRSPALEWTLPIENFSHVLSIYGGHFMDMLFHSVGMPRTVSAIAATQFPILTLSSTGQEFSNDNPDAFIAQGWLTNQALFQIHVEGGKQNPSGLQIEITGTDGELKITNERSFTTKHHDVIEGAHGSGSPWSVICAPAGCNLIPTSNLDVSVQDLAQLYAAYANDRETGSRTARTFADAVAMHELIDAITQSSTTGNAITLKGEA